MIEWDIILYVFGLGFGEDLVDKKEFVFVYEDGLKVVFLMVVMMGYLGFWLCNFKIGVNW